MNEFPPVFVLSTGRCGSTMVSEMLNKHPNILSVSELFSTLGLTAFPGRKVNGEWMWRLLNTPGGRMRILARETRDTFSELLYPFDEPGHRFNAATLPPVMAITLPHLTDRYEELYDAIGPFVRARPRASAPDHYRALFDWLGVRLGRKVWIERHGGSLLLASRLLRNFPEARVVHVFRDGRETTLSLSRHPAFRFVVGRMNRARRARLDLYKLVERLEGHDWITSLLDNLQWLRPIPDSDFDHQATLPEFGEFWSRMIETGHRVFGHFPPERLLNLRFEDMQANPERESRRLIRFIAPELENDDWVAEVSKIPRKTSSKFARLDPEMQRAITEACRPGLVRLGYAV